ncbi:hypothetical protein LEP1GSC170_1083 [Leptospira interrogans serovar Bataviae str. HAI135]|nr:hypothetical protein LEP1GSC170_1083 [Leptospira interrogans serovar Bataviae str. HAI135]
MGSMHLGLEGMPMTAERMIAFYGRRFDGGASFITTGGIAINHEGKGSNIFLIFRKKKTVRNYPLSLILSNPKVFFAHSCFTLEDTPITENSWRLPH